jgi:hypothetical protein
MGGMVDGVRLSKEELKGRYGLTERMAVRIGALTSKGLEVSGAVLEESARTKDVEALLLSPELLAGAAGLDAKGVKELTKQPLTVMVQDGRRILALEEEALAEKAWLPAPTARPGVVGLDGPEARQIFSTEEVGRIKMTVLTGVDPRLKVEALRKLAFAPLSPEEKGVLALRALGDPDGEVRREAAASLEHLGLNRDLSDALKDAAGGTPKQRQLALRKIGAMTSLGPVERSVTLAALTSAMAFERDGGAQRELLGALEAYAAALAANGEALARFAGNLVKMLAEDLAGLAAPARALLERLGETKSTGVAAAMWRDVEAVNDRKLKIFGFEALARLPMEPGLEATLCAKAAQELAGGISDDFDARRLADALFERGDAALDALLSVLPGAKEGSVAFLVTVVDAIATGPKSGDPARAKAGEAFVNLLTTGSRVVRTSIMEARLPWHASLPAALKGRFAADFITNLHAYRTERMLDLTSAAIRRMGFAASDALRECIRKSPYPAEREASIRLLAEIAAGSADVAAVAEAITFLRKQEEAGRVAAGIVARAVGRAAVSPGAAAEVVNGTCREYLARIGKVAHSFDLLEALGWIASSPSCDSMLAVDVVLRLMGLLESPMPDLEVTESKTDEGTHLQLGGSTRVYTDLVPDLIEGVKRVLLSGRVGPKMEDDLVARLAAKYADLVAYKDIWAPGNLLALAGAMGEIAIAPGAPAARRARIVEALLANVRNITMVRVLGRVFGASGEPADAAARFVGRCLEMLDRPEYGELEDQWVLMEALGRACRAKQIGRTKAESDERKRRIVDLLLERQDKFTGIRELLRELAASDHLPKPLKKQIESTRGRR